MKRTKTTALVLSLFGVAAGVFFLYPREESLTIASIKEDCEALSGQVVEFKGMVNKVYNIPFVRYDLYRVYYNTGEVWIVTEKGCPNVNDRLKIRGIPQPTDRYLKDLNLPAMVFRIVEKLEIGKCILIEESKTVL